VKREHKTISFSSVVSGVVTVQGDEGGEQPATGKDRIRQVVAVNEVFGRVHDQACILTVVEIWDRHVRAAFLAEIGDRERADREEFHRALGEWMRAKRRGEATEADRPDMARAHGFPGMSVTWVVEGAGVRSERRGATGQGGEDWQRLEVEWDLALPDRCDELVISV
jgi:hypothetical protein